MKKTILILITFLISTTAFSETNSSTIGNEINGSFQQNGETITAEVVLTQKGHENPNADYTPDECKVKFSNPSIKAIDIYDSCEVTLVNEGDLNNDGKDDISVYSAPLHGCTYKMVTYSLINGIMQPIVPLFLVQTACNPLSNKDIEDLVFKDKGLVYFMDFDPNDESGKLIKKKVFIK